MFEGFINRCKAARRSGELEFIREELSIGHRIKEQSNKAETDKCRVEDANVSRRPNRTKETLPKYENIHNIDQCVRTVETRYNDTTFP